MKFEVKLEKKICVQECDEEKQLNYRGDGYNDKISKNSYRNTHFFVSKSDLRSEKTEKRIENKYVKTVQNLQVVTFTDDDALHLRNCGQ